MVLPLALLINAQNPVPAIALEPDQALTFRVLESAGKKTSDLLMLASVGEVSKKASGEFIYQQPNDLEYPVRDLLVFVSPKTKTHFAAVVYPDDELAVKKSTTLNFGASTVKVQLTKPRTIAWTPNRSKPWFSDSTKPAGKPVKGAISVAVKGDEAGKWYAMQSTQDGWLGASDDQLGGPPTVAEETWEFQVIDTFRGDGKSWKYHASKLRVRKVQERVSINVVTGETKTDRKTLIALPEIKL